MPSDTDEDTFERVFGACDWAVMFIISRTAATYARLSLRVGPGAAIELPVSVDWSAWPTALATPQVSVANLLADWQTEFTTNIQDLASTLLLPSSFEELQALGGPLEPFTNTWDWTDLDHELLEDLKRHERSLRHPEP